jgi:glycosyltransferase involved in cell wall biosynthesis
MTFARHWTGTSRDALAWVGSVKLVFINRFFYPDHSATSQLLSDLAFALAARGHSVAVIASRQRYDAPGERLPPYEIIEGVAVHRVWTSRFGRANLAGRAIDYATFFLAAGWRLWRVLARGDVAVAKTDPPMLSVIAGPLCRWRGAKPVNWLQDIFPETAQALTVGGRLGLPVLFLLRRLRSRSLRAAHMNVVLGQRMAEHVVDLGVREDRIRVIPNWADGANIVPVEPAANALRREWQLGDAFVVGYSGNLGRVHEIDTLLEAITIMETQEATVTATAGPAAAAIREATPPPRVLWLFIGSGALYEALRAEATRRGLTSVRFKPYQPQARLAESLSAADVHLVSLRAELEGLIVPSKFYGIAAAGRPAIFVGDPDGEIARLVSHYQCGRTVTMGDGAGLARTVVELATTPEVCRRMGQRAREALDGELDRPIALARWETLLLEVADAVPKCFAGRAQQASAMPLRRP